MSSVNIDSYLLENDDLVKANQLLSDFFQVSVTIIKGERPVVPGRTVRTDKLYRLEVDNGRHVGIKRKYNERTDFGMEFFVHDIRDQLEMQNYRIQKNRGFPMDGPNWRKPECLFTDWGDIGCRVDLATLHQTALPSNDVAAFLGQLGNNAAFCFLLGLFDRNKRNFVWDTQEKRIISIDHESLSGRSFDREILSEISLTVKKFFSENWYDDDNLKNIFTAGFCSTWQSITAFKSQILCIYKKFCLNISIKRFEERLSLNPSAPLNVIFS